MVYFCQMNKKLLYGVAFLMSAALIGIMAVQFYLIGDAIKVKEATFVRDVNQAIGQVVVNLEKEEMQRQYEYHVRLMNQRANLMAVYDSLKRSIAIELQKPMTKDEYAAFIRRSTIAEEKIQDMIFGYSETSGNIKELQPLHIDSLLSNEFRRYGIDTHFELGIYSPTKNLMLFQKTGRYPQQLMEQSFAFDLYPTISPAMFADKLLVYFPHEKRFLMKQMASLIFVTGALVLVIIAGFGATVWFILKQKKLSEMKNDFVNNMTHEFKTPISTIGLACEALRDPDVQKSEVLYSNYISIIDEENKRLGLMAEQVLQSAAHEKGVLLLKHDKIDLHEIAKDAVATKMLQAKSRSGHIFADLKAEDSMVMGDKVHLTNVVLNLLDNALKYTEEAPQIVVRSRNIPNAIELSVTDNGIGISKANQKRIFEKLFRVPTGNVHNVKGFGLGLSYVKAVVEKLGGTTGVHSELKKGSTFYIRLPLSSNY